MNVYLVRGISSRIPDEGGLESRAKLGNVRGIRASVPTMEDLMAGVEHILRSL